MLRIVLTSALVMAGFATLALAHSGVTNPAVLARMDSMKVTQDSTKVLGTMVKGERPFDVQTARAAAQEIANHAQETPKLFKARETDPKSEALPAIWDNFADFSEKSASLEVAARTLAETLETEDQLRAGLGRIGAACKSCHEAYRE